MTAKRPLLWICIAYRALMGVAVAAPLSIGVAGIIGGHPRSDAVLWEPGGYWLLECARIIRTSITAHLAAGGVAGAALAIGWLLPLGALIAALGEPELRGTRLLARAWQRFAGLVLLYGGTLVAQGLVLAAFFFLARRLAAPDRAGDILALSLVAAAGVLCGVIAVGHDAARVLWVQERPPFFVLINKSFELVRARPLATLLAASWRAALGWGLFITALALGTWCMTRGSIALAVAWTLHLAAVGGYVALRASWLGWLTSWRAPGPSAHR